MSVVRASCIIHRVGLYHARVIDKLLTNPLSSLSPPPSTHRRLGTTPVRTIPIANVFRKHVRANANGTVVPGGLLVRHQRYASHVCRRLSADGQRAGRDARRRYLCKSFTIDDQTAVPHRVAFIRNGLLKGVSKRRRRSSRQSPGCSFE